MLTLFLISLIYLAIGSLFAGWLQANMTDALAKKCSVNEKEGRKLNVWNPETKRLSASAITLMVVAWPFFLGLLVSFALVEVFTKVFAGSDDK